MKIIYKNTKLRLEKYVKAFSSGWVSELILYQISHSNYGYKVLTGNYGCYWYKNETDEPLTFHIYNCTGNRYYSNPFVAITDEVPSSDIASGITSVVWAQQLTAVDITVTVPAGKYIGLSELALADSGDMVPDVDINGTHVPLPSKT